MAPPKPPQPRRGGRASPTGSVAPSGAVKINSTPSPTAHAVGYSLAPLRGSGVRPRKLTPMCGCPAQPTAGWRIAPTKITGLHSSS
ncbi:hypothetical protein SBA2_110019 [Acidobacteriia bacterium SbA2]|nr:hypothetical protein SBA2_110019 [Acidobacteriia bacterium SbA2]